MAQKIKKNLKNIFQKTKKVSRDIVEIQLVSNFHGDSLKTTTSRSTDKQQQQQQQTTNKQTFAHHLHTTIIIYYSPTGRLEPPPSGVAQLKLLLPRASPWITSLWQY